jgi:hypothetical protein
MMAVSRKNQNLVMTRRLPRTTTQSGPPKPVTKDKFYTLCCKPSRIKQRKKKKKVELRTHMGRYARSAKPSSLRAVPENPKNAGSKPNAMPSKEHRCNDTVCRNAKPPPSIVSCAPSFPETFPALTMGPENTGVIDV